jgi:hypothetical protein
MSIHDADALSRRSLFQAAGGFTFLALSTPAHRPLADLRVGDLGGLGDDPAVLPVVVALPYIQPGPKGSRLVEGQESVVIAWQTDPVKADFRLTYGPAGDEKAADIRVASRAEGYEYPKDARLNYSASLEGLKLETKYRYRVSMNGKRWVEGFFTTRKPRGKKARFVAFGDNSNGDPSERAIAYRAYRVGPDFVMNTGDNVYNDGRDGDYGRYFFPIYNADEASSIVGAPILRSVPFYSVLANHDVNSEDPKGHPVADFERHPDALGYYSNLHLPLNGPEPTYPTPVQGPAERISAFKTATGNRFPTMANYSFDYGDGHFLCLDANVTINPTDPALQSWIEKDLSSTDAPWKFVVYHHPAFGVGKEHYEEQHMRALSPRFEKLGVDIVLNGHEHVYQRTRPIRFMPSDLSAAAKVGEEKRLIPGTFTVDREFDGKKVTRAKGVVHITTGAGGNSLYDPEMNRTPEAWLHQEDANADYVAQMITDRHSFTVVDMDARSLSLRQIDEWGQVIDLFEFSK